MSHLIAMYAIQFNLTVHTGSRMHKHMSNANVSLMPTMNGYNCSIEEQRTHYLG